MAKFKVTWDYIKQGKSHHEKLRGNVADVLGAMNDGVKVDASDEKAAREKVGKMIADAGGGRPGDHINTGWLKVVKEGKNTKLKKSELVKIVNEVVYEMLQAGDKRLIKLMMESEGRYGADGKDVDVDAWVARTASILGESIGITPEEEKPNILTEEQNRFRHLAGINESAGITIGDEVMLGFGSKGGAGYVGVVKSIDGNTVHITSPEGRTYSGPLKNATLETPKGKIPNNKYRVR